MTYSLPEAVKAAHALSPQGQKKLKAAIAEQYGPQTLPVKEQTAEEKQAADDKKQQLANQAKAAEEARNAAEDQAITDILAAVGHTELFDETRESALRAIAEVIGVHGEKGHSADAPTFGSPDTGLAAVVNETPDLESKTVAELREIAAEREIEIGSRATKNEIIDALNQGRGGAR